MRPNRPSKSASKIRLTWPILTLVLVFANTSISLGAPAGPHVGILDSVNLPPEAQAGPSGAATNRRAIRNPKLDSALAAVVEAAKTSNEEALSLAESQSLRLADDRIQVQIVTQPSDLRQVITAVSQMGGQVTGVGFDDSLVQAWLPIRALESVAAQDSVQFVRRPVRAFPLENLHVGSATTEGLSVLNGLAWHLAGYTGAGVKVGIIDAGFQGYAARQGSADLPVLVIVKNFVDGENEAQVDGTSPHGTASAEIIHDIAPDADIYLAKIYTDLDLAEAVAWLITQQVDIISTSIGFYNATPGDGTGPLADLVSLARSAGILWVTAAGNDRVTHWGGIYNNIDGDSFHEFADGGDVNCFTFSLFGGSDCSAIFFGDVYIFLRWSDWNQVDQNYDLHLVRWNGTNWENVASSTDVQDGSPGQTPTEWITASIFDFAPYGIRIERVSGNRPVNFELFTPGLISFGFSPYEILHARSLANLADSPGAVTVAALDVNAPFPQEFYSSEGPTNGPGGSELGGFTKPDLAAYANVSTVSYGAGVFNGTSAATPHVAGAAALVLGALPSFSPDQLQSFLAERAVDMGSPGLDPKFGRGRLFLGDPPSSQTDLTYVIYLPAVLKTAP